MKVLTKAHIASEIREKYALKHRESIEVVDTFFDMLSGHLSNGGSIRIRGFGSFDVKMRKRKVARNIHTRETIISPPKKVVKFKTSKKLRIVEVVR